MIVIDILEWLFQGTRGMVVSAVSGAVIGSWLTARLTYGFQRALLKEQFAQQAKSQEAAFQAIDQKILVPLLTRWNNTFEVLHRQLDDISRNQDNPP